MMTRVAILPVPAEAVQSVADHATFVNRHSRGSTAARRASAFADAARTRDKSAVAEVHLA